MSYDEVSDVDSAKKALSDIAGLEADDEISKLIVTFYNMFKTGATVTDVKIVAEVERQSDVEII